MDKNSTQIIPFMGEKEKWSMLLGNSREIWNQGLQYPNKSPRKKSQQTMQF